MSEANGGNKILVKIMATVKAAFVFLACLFIWACSSAPTHTLVAKQESAHSPAKDQRYTTKQPNIPSAVYALIDQAQQAREQDQMGGALSLLERAQRLAPNFSVVYLELGHTYLALNNHQRAKHMYLRALSLAANSSERRNAQLALQEQ